MLDLQNLNYLRFFNQLLLHLINSGGGGGGGYVSYILLQEANTLDYW